jgi:SAM-dependent methyltransferase
MEPLTSTFDRVYETHRWTAAGNGSGPGSALRPDAPLVAGLVTFLKDRRIRSIVDVSCGGMAWWPYVLTASDPETRFFGYDVSQFVITRNRHRFDDAQNWLFSVADARVDQFPEVDLLICRQTLNHLWTKDALAVLANITRSARYLGLTHDPTVVENTPDAERTALFDDCNRATCYAPLNLGLPPFGMHAPETAISDVDGQVLAIYSADLVGNR